MANRNGPMGLRPVRKLGGGDITNNGYDIAVDYTTAIYTGDVVEMTGTGKNIAVAASGNVDNIGVFAGCSYTDSDGSTKFSPYWPGVTGKTNVKAYVYDDPDIVFEVQGDSVAAADIGTLVDYTVGTGSTITGLSGLTATVNGATGTTGKSLRIMRLVDRPDNAYGAYAKIEVMIAEHALKGVVAGVGGV